MPKWLWFRSSSIDSFIEGETTTLFLKKIVSSKAWISFLIDKYIFNSWGTFKICYVHPFLQNSSNFFIFLAKNFFFQWNFLYSDFISLKFLDNKSITYIYLHDFHTTAMSYLNNFAAILCSLREWISEFFFLKAS